MKEIAIVRTKSSHLKELMEIELQSFPVPWSYESYRQEIEENDMATYFTAIKGNSVVGYAGMWDIIDEGHITTIAVVDEMRKKGIGMLLINTLINYARDNNIDSLTLEVRESNIAALKLYEKLGFERKGLRRKYYSDNGENAVIMWLENIK